MSRCTLVNPLCPDDLCVLSYGHDGTDEGRHHLSTMIEQDHVSDLMFMAPKGTSPAELMRRGDARARMLWPHLYEGEGVTWGTA